MEALSNDTMTTFRSIFRRTSVLQLTDSVVITEGTQKGVQCLRSPPPRKDSLRDILSHFKGATLTDRADDITSRAVEGYLKLDTTLSSGTIETIGSLMKNRRLSNKQVVKKIKHFFVPDKISLWQGISAYIIKSTDPSLKDRASRKSSRFSVGTFDTGSAPSSRSTSSTRTTAVIGDIETQLLSKESRSKNSRSKPALENDLDRNLSHVEDEPEESRKEQEEGKPSSSQTNRDDTVEKGGADPAPLEIDALEKAKLGGTLVPEEPTGSNIDLRQTKPIKRGFHDAAKRIKEGVTIIRDLVRAAKKFQATMDLAEDGVRSLSSTFLNYIMQDDTDEKKSESQTRTITDRMSAISVSESSPLVTASSDTQETDIERSSSDSSEDSDSQDETQNVAPGSTLMMDIVAAAKEGQKVFNQKGMEVVDVHAAVAVDSDDLIWDIGVKSLLSLAATSTSDVDTKVMREESVLQYAASSKSVVKREESFIQLAAMSRSSVIKKTKSEEFQMSLEIHQEEDTHGALPKSESQTRTITDRLTETSVSESGAIEDSERLQDHPDVEPSSDPVVKDKSEAIEDSERLQDHPDVKPSSDPVVKDKDSVFETGLVQEAHTTEKEQPRDAQVDEDGRHKADLQGRKSSTSNVVQEIFFNEDKSKAVAVTMRGHKRKLYDHRRRRIVSIPGQCSEWLKVYDKNCQEVINIYGKAKLAFKIYDENHQEVLNLDDYKRMVLKLKTQDEEHVSHKSRDAVKKSPAGPKQRSEKKHAEVSVLKRGEKLPDTITTKTTSARCILQASLTRKVQPLDDSVIDLTIPDNSEKAEQQERKTNEPPALLSDCPRRQPVAPNAKLDAKKYMEKHGIHQLFEMFLNNLVLEQPSQPIDYLINLVRNVGLCERKSVHMDRVKHGD